MAKDGKLYWIGPGNFMGASFGQEIKGEVAKEDLVKLKKRGHISSTSLKPDVSTDSAAKIKIKELNEKIKELKQAFDVLTVDNAELTKEVEDLKKVNGELKEMLK